MQTFSTAASAAAIQRRRGERVVGLELDHRPDGNAHRRERVLEWMKLGGEGRLDAGRGLVAGPEVVAERLDDVVGGDADVRLAVLDDLEHRLQHADDRAERPVDALGEAAQPVEVAEQLVRAIDQVDDHSGSMPAALMTCPHFCASAAWKRASSSELVVVHASVPVLS